MRKVLCFAVTVFLLLLSIPSAHAETVPAYCIMPLHSETVISERDSDTWYNIAGACKGRGAKRSRASTTSRIFMLLHIWVQS